MKGLGLDPVHDTRTTFRALCRAMSRPGTVQSVPAPADRAVFSTLSDHEVPVHTPDETLRQALDHEGRLREAPPESAQLLHARGVPEWDVRNANRGSLVEPSDGATVLYRIEGWHGTGLTVRGPGVPDERTVEVSLPAAECDRVVATQTDFPRGVDAVFATESEITALPRSATVEVV